MFEFKTSVISDFQQIPCCLELLSRLGRAKGRTCGHTPPPTRVSAETGPRQTVQHTRRTDDERITDRFL